MLAVQRPHLALLQLNKQPATVETEDISAEIRNAILEYVRNSQCHGVGIQVLKITALPDKWSLPKNGRKIMLFHGTKEVNVPAIKLNGLTLPKPKKQMFGTGIYFADRCSKSSQYIPNTRYPSIPQPGTTGIILLCEVNVGNCQTATTHNHSATSPPPGFDSIFCQGRNIPGNTKTINGVEWPVGATTVTSAPSLLRYNEYVVYDPKYVNVKYVLNVQFTDKPVITS